jgi:phenylalanyl-tRNA synthetase alpha chain
MLDRLNDIESQGLDTLRSIQDEAGLEAWRVGHLGRSSALTLLFNEFGQLSREERPVVGQRANEVKKSLEAAFITRSEEIRQAELSRSIEQERLDITLPGRRIPIGRLHPDTRILRELYRIFGDMGFQVYRSREVESDEYNFQLLNFPIGHPARDMQDTYFIENGQHGDNPVVLIKHTHFPGSDSRHARIFYPKPTPSASCANCAAGDGLSLRTGGCPT